MATRQNPTFKRRLPAPTLTGAGIVSVARFDFDLSAGLLAADILEIGVIPAGRKLLRAHLSTTGIDATASIDIGILTGTAGDLENTRTMNATGEIFEAATKNVATAMATPQALDAIAASNADRGIGLRLSADEAAGANTNGYLIVEFYNP